MVPSLIDNNFKFLLKKYKWTWNSKTGFIVKCKGKTLYLHRLITNCPDNKVVDHINGKRYDNRISNLRICTQTQNTKNQCKPKNNTTGYKGVVKSHHKSRPWCAQIKVNYKRINLGYYKNKKDAAKAYNDAAVKHFGEFANVNKL